MNAGQLGGGQDLFRCCFLVEAGDVVETHHFATLVGFGASAVNPYLAIETLIEIGIWPINREPL